MICRYALDYSKVEHSVFPSALRARESRNAKQANLTKNPGTTRQMMDTAAYSELFGGQPAMMCEKFTERVFPTNYERTAVNPSVSVHTMLRARLQLNHETLTRTATHKSILNEMTACGKSRLHLIVSEMYSPGFCADDDDDDDDVLLYKFTMRRIRKPQSVEHALDRALELHWHIRINMREANPPHKHTCARRASSACGGGGCFGTRMTVAINLKEFRVHKWSSVFVRMRSSTVCTGSSAAPTHTRQQILYT